MDHKWLRIGAANLMITAHSRRVRQGDGSPPCLPIPPLRTCLCGSRRAEWVRLSARARVVTQTLGPDGAFALVQFEGADGLATCAIDAIAEALDAPTPEDAAAGAPAFAGSLRLIASDPPRLVLGQET